MKNILKFVDYIKESIINEDGDGGGVATVTATTTSGMGNVASAQPSSTPGAIITGDGTTGSGDYGNALFPTAQKDGGNILGKKRGEKRSKKSKKKDSIIQNFLKQHKSKEDKLPSKVFNFKDFVNNDIKD